MNKQNSTLEVYRFSDLVASPGESGQRESKEVSSPNVVSPDLAHKKAERIIIVGKYFFEDGSFYVGEIDVLKKIIHGRGKWTYASGEEHHGDFEQGQRHGEGTFTTAEGDQLTGVWTHDILGGNASHEYMNGDVFVGKYQNGKKNGIGRLTTECGKVLDGTWEDDVMRTGVEVLEPSTIIDGVQHWSLKCLDASGSSYEGQVRGNIMHGEGKYVYPNGDVYEGSFVNGEKSGHGCLEFTLSTSNERIRYTGQFDKNKMNGKGTMEFENKSVYRGDFLDGHWDGEGEFTYANGDVYNGGYMKNLKHGFGVFKWADGSSYEGGYEQNKWSGKAKYTHSNGDEYTGSYLNGRKHGQGKFVWADSCAIYSGAYENGMKHGFGKHIYASGDEYEGMYENNQKHGVGKLTISSGDGDVYEGPFMNGKKHGKGRVTLATGELFDVIFDQDERVSQELVGHSSIEQWLDEQCEGTRQGAEHQGEGPQQAQIMNLEDDNDDANSVGNKFSTRRNMTLSVQKGNAAPVSFMSSNRPPPLNTAWQ
mmetsp:Transcript_25876/g.43666  ORF Transcript_25876/g.43666 Transcript_25876/m.43666 type:complete len:534 (-) Transcript_25876:631-2232(-)